MEDLRAKMYSVAVPHLGASKDPPSVGDSQIGRPTLEEVVARYESTPDYWMHFLDESSDGGTRLCAAVKGEAVRQLKKLGVAIPVKHRRRIRRRVKEREYRRRAREREAERRKVSGNGKSTTG